MMDIVYLMDLIAVGFFGIILSVSFCCITRTRQKYAIMAGGTVVLFGLQGIVYLLSDIPTVLYFYPIIIHLPLALLLCILSKNCLWSVISVLTAYLFCQTRRWLALLIVAVCGGSDLLQNAAEIVLTIPLLFILIRTVAPAMHSVSRQKFSEQCQFGLIPALYYGFDYLTGVYTDLLSDAAPAVIEFMPFACSVAYMIFLLWTSKAERERSQLEQARSILNLQIEGAAREIESLRKLQRSTTVYRHDMRHHLQYLLNCIKNDRLEQAQTYIQGICSEIEAEKVSCFCENDTANLIFSAFAGRAESNGIQLKIRASIPQNVSIADSDLCVLLSNVLENALHACEKQIEKNLPGTIEVSAYEKGGKLFLQVANSCDEAVTFVNGIPVTEDPGHGIGIRSVCAIVERYHGIYSFSCGDGAFVLRAAI